MSFIDFLLQYYIWILGVLILLILIIIGVLVDSKSKGKEKNTEKKKNSAPDAQATNIQNNEPKKEGNVTLNTMLNSNNMTNNNVGGEKLNNIAPLPQNNEILSNSNSNLEGEINNNPLNTVPENATNSISQINQVEQPMQDINPVPQINPMEQPEQNPNEQENEIYTTNGAQPFDINSMFANNK